MKVCTKHKHTDWKSARDCYSKEVRKRLDRRLGDDKPPSNKVQMRRNRPPRLTKHGEVWMIVFEEDALMEY